VESMHAVAVGAVAMESATAVGAVAMESATAVDIATVVPYLPVYKARMMLEGAIPQMLVQLTLYFDPTALPVTLEPRGGCLVQLIHSSHDRDRWNRGYVLVEAAEILTWAERGMPLHEHCRTPLWPNSDLERTSPGLTFPSFRRVRCRNYRGDALRIA
jgi:hypothetical protein